MNTEKIDNQLRDLFSEQKSEDLQRVPEFEAVARRSTQGRFTPCFAPSPFRFASGAAAVVLLISGVTLAAIRLHTRSVEREIQQWAALSTWEAPTDPLLRISGVSWPGTNAMPSDFLMKTSNAASDKTTVNP